MYHQARTCVLAGVSARSRHAAEGITGDGGGADSDRRRRATGAHLRRSVSCRDAHGSAHSSAHSSGISTASTRPPKTIPPRPRTWPRTVDEVADRTGRDQPTSPTTTRSSATSAISASRYKGHEQGPALRREPAQEIPRPLDAMRIQPVGRFVEQQRVRVTEQGGRQPEPASPSRCPLPREKVPCRSSATDVSPTEASACPPGPGAGLGRSQHPWACCRSACRGRGQRSSGVPAMFGVSRDGDRLSSAGSQPQVTEYVAHWPLGSHPHRRTLRTPPAAPKRPA